MAEPRIPDNVSMQPSRRAVAPSFSTPDFRAALGMFATGVTVVTARRADGTLVGLTANSFNSVSLEPPLVLWSLARSNTGIEPAERFAGKAADRFSDVAFSDGAGGAPVLEGAAAVFECFNRSQYEEGDHVIFVGEVERCSWRPGVAPLIFHGGRYFTELPL
jgi:flavin reductase (DIM6/NTAB) family NADH-FMN oxidoreductase RutF